MDNQMPPKLIMTQMILGYVTSKAIHVASKLNLADLIDEHGPLDCKELADKTKADEESIHRLLRALSSIDIFNEDQNGKFSLTPLAECLKEEGSSSMKAMSLSTGSVFYKVFDELLYSIKSGEGGFAKAHGMPVFDYLSNNPEEGKIFDRMMTDFHGDETKPMIDNYDFSIFNKVIDIGGGNGEVISAVLNKNKGLKGVLFDVPEVINRSQEIINSKGLTNICSLEAGNFFESVSQGGDAYILRHIIHDWSDEDAIRILKNCRISMNPEGKILVVEAVIPEGNDPNPFKWLDLTMLMIGGKERSKNQFEHIFSQSGLKLTKIIQVTANLSIIEGILK